MQIRWFGVLFGITVCLVLFYFPFLGWIFAPLVGGVVASYLASPAFKWGAFSGATVGFVGATLWFVISTVHWGSWVALLYKIGWITEANSLPIIMGLTFVAVYIGFGFIGGIMGYFFKKYKMFKFGLRLK